MDGPQAEPNALPPSANFTIPQTVDSFFGSLSPQDQGRSGLVGSGHLYKHEDDSVDEGDMHSESEEGDVFVFFMFFSYIFL